VSRKRPLNETLQKCCQKRLKAPPDVSDCRLTKHRLINSLGTFVNEIRLGRGGPPQAVFRQKFLQSYRKARWPITRSAPNCGPRGGRTGPPGPRPDAGGRPRDPRLARRALEAPAGAPPAAPAAGRLVLQWQAQGQPARHETCAQRGASAQPRAVGRCAPASAATGAGFPGRAGRVAQGPPAGLRSRKRRRLQGRNVWSAQDPRARLRGGPLNAMACDEVELCSLRWKHDGYRCKAE
jgi:hypothetical protein